MKPGVCGGFSRTGDSGGFPTVAGGFSRTGKMFFSGAVFDWPPRFAGDPFGLLKRLDLPPFMRRGLSVRRQVREPKKVWRAKFTAAGLSRPGVFDKAKSAHLTNAGADSVPLNCVVLKICERHLQPAVVLATMAGQFDLEAGEDSVSA